MKQKKETQQFARFFLKDIKSKPVKDENNKSTADELIFSTSN